ncbi:MAG: carboxymuconolactone decarboxylase family protein [Nocardioides sp.]|uniref:carboxymuconolactone decarboxylase family protein n=1 Tax=Nocardioides sp. TaxID=35761 RepID=UPI0039E2DEE2
MSQGHDTGSPRLAGLRPGELTAEQAAVYEHIAGGERASGPQYFELVDAEGRLNGPFNAMLLSPGLGDALQGLGAAIRYQSSLSGRVREMAILAVAAHWESEFERYAHEPIGRAAGLTEDEIAALGKHQSLTLLDPAEYVALRVVRALLASDGLDDAGYAAAREHLSEAELFELTTLVGYYATLALMMRVFDVGAPGQSQP